MADQNIRNLATPQGHGASGQGKGGSLTRPKTSGDPNTQGGLGGRDRSTSGLRERDLSVDLPSASHPLGSGVGAGNVNAALNSKYRMDYQLLQDLQSKLREDTNENALNIQQR